MELNKQWKESPFQLFKPKEKYIFFHWFWYQCTDLKKKNQENL